MNEFELFPEEESEDAAAKRAGTIQSVSIAARFLNILAAAGQELPLGELARRAGAGRSTAHRYLQTLVKERLARQDPVSGHYDLGPAALTIGLGALQRVDTVAVAARHMKDLTRRLAISGGVAIWTDRGPVLVRWYRSPLFAINPLVLGDILPVDNSACGQVFQAFLPESAIATARANQPEHYRGASVYSERLEEIRRTGWAEMTSHLLANVTGQAAPVFDAQGELSCVMATITDLGRLSGPEDRSALLLEAGAVNAATGGAGVSPALPG